MEEQELVEKVKEFGRDAWRGTHKEKLAKWQAFSDALCTQLGIPQIKIIIDKSDEMKSRRMCYAINEGKERLYKFSVISLLTALRYAEAIHTRNTALVIENPIEWAFSIYRQAFPNEARKLVRINGAYLHPSDVKIN